MLLATLVVTGCSGDAEPAAAPAGAARDTSLAIDRLAEQAATFELAIAQAPWTL